MNSYGKKLMGIALIAALSSGITIGAFSILNKSADSKIQDQSLDSGYAQPTRFTRVINRPAVETDFTTAAENTVNAVVSIKSISTPKQSQLGGFIAISGLKTCTIGVYGIRTRAQKIE